MKKLLAATALCMLFSATALAAEQRIRDFSSSIPDSFNDANSQKSTGGGAIGGVGVNNNTYQAPQPYGQPYPDQNDPYADSGYGQQQPQSNHFMINYCDPNYKAGGIAHTAISECIAQSRQNACQAYAALPADARRAMDLRIDCKYAATENQGGEQDDGTLGNQPIAPKNCENSAEIVLALLKKYYQDTNMVQALLYLPDEALNAGAQCVNTGR